MAGRVIRVRAPHEPVSTKYQVLSIKYLELSQRVRSQFFEGVWKGTILYPPCTECGDMRGTFEDEGGREAAPSREEAGLLAASRCSLES